MKLSLKKSKTAKNTTHALQYAINFSYWWGTTKYRWDKGSAAPIRVVATQTRTWIFLMSFIIQMVHVPWLVVTTIQMAFSDDKLVNESKVFVEFMAIAYAMPVCSMQMFLVWRSETVADFLNTVIVTHTQMNGNLKRVNVNRHSLVSVGI